MATQEQADAILAEFMAKRSAPVTRYKAHVKGPRHREMRNELPDPLERIEYEPDNSRIGRESRGLQSESLVSRAIAAGCSSDVIARAMVQEYHETLVGIPYRMRAIASFRSATPSVLCPKPVGCESRPASIGNWFLDVSEQMKPSVKQVVDAAEAARMEPVKWRRSRIARLGQSPRVTVPRLHRTK